MFGFRRILDSFIYFSKEKNYKKMTKYMFFAIMLEMDASKN